MDSKFPSASELLPKLTKVIYHGEDCADGYMCKFLIQEWFNERKLRVPKFIPANRKEQNYELKDLDYVLMVDFIYKEDVIKKWLTTTPHIFAIDHHNTSMKCPLPDDHKLLDMERSACTIVQEWLDPLKHKSRLLTLIEDRDMWTKK